MEARQNDLKEDNWWLRNLYSNHHYDFGCRHYCFYSCLHDFV